MYSIKINELNPPIMSALLLNNKAITIMLKKNTSGIYFFKKLKLIINHTSLTLPPNLLTIFISKRSLFFASFGIFKKV